MLRPHPHKTFIYHDLFVAWARSEKKHFLPWQVRCSQCKEVFYHSLSQTPLALTGVDLYLLHAPVSVQLIQWDPRGVAFNRLRSHTNNLLTFFVFFWRGGDPDLSLSSSELLLALTPSAIASWMLDLVGSVSHITRAALEQRALNFTMTC